jgi:hypothetical protein
MSDGQLEQLEPLDPLLAKLKDELLKPLLDELPGVGRSGCAAGVGSGFWRF